jgi:hypothetical protein
MNFMSNCIEGLAGEVQLGFAGIAGLRPVVSRLLKRRFDKYIL